MSSPFNGLHGTMGEVRWPLGCRDLTVVKLAVGSVSVTWRSAEGAGRVDLRVPPCRFSILITGNEEVPCFPNYFQVPGALSNIRVY